MQNIVHQCNHSPWKQNPKCCAPHLWVQLTFWSCHKPLGWQQHHMVFAPWNHEQYYVAVKVLSLQRWKCTFVQGYACGLHPVGQGMLQLDHCDHGLIHIVNFTATAQKSKLNFFLCITCTIPFCLHHKQKCIPFSHCLQKIYSAFCSSSMNWCKPIIAPENRFEGDSIHVWPWMTKIFEQDPENKDWGKKDWGFSW